MPPLPLTGERTLPDVPEENYWYRRHLVVYEWIAARVAGLRVVDMACGEGYGSDVLAGAAAAVVGVDANPEAHEHARLRYTRPNLRFERDLVESFAEPCDAVVFLQTIEHVEDAGAILEHFKSMLAPGGVAYVSTPNLLTLAPPGAEKSDNPWHVHEYRAEEFRELCEAHFPRVELLGLFHARKLRVHELAIKLGWDPVHKRLGLTKPFYDRFTPAIAASDFASGKGTSTRHWTSRRLPHGMSGRPAEPARSAGDLAIVLHTHMPYVEGFGTYPFGEEWLFDAVIRSYLPVLEVARDLTMTVTPVLADQLEDAGVRERLRRLPGRVADRRRRGRPRRRSPPECRPACEARAGPLPARAGAARRRRRRSAARPSSGRRRRAGWRWRPPRRPTRCCRCWRPARGCACSSTPASARTAAASAGTAASGCPSAPTRRASSGALAEHGVALVLRRPERATRRRWRRWRRCATEAGPVALPIDWEAISWLWSLDGYPSDPAHAQFAGKSLRGMRLWKVGGGAYDPDAAAAAARRQAGEFLAAAAARLRELPPPSGRRGLLVFAIDTELLGHWWSEGPIWLRAVLEGAEAAGVRLLTVPQALAEHEPVARPLAASTWGEDKDFGTWDSPAGRRPRLGRRGGWSCGCCGRSPAACADAAALRAARELLAVQASDWAFLDKRGQAGDYAFQRATDHAGALFEAIDSGSRHRPAYALPRPGPEPRSPAGALAPLTMTRVLILSWEYPPLIEGGLARHVRKLSEALVERDVEVHVLTRGGEESPAEERAGGVIVHRIREPKRPTDLGEFVAWVERMNSDMLAAGVELGDRYDFDLVHGHDWLVANACDHLAKRFDAPLVTTIHATEHGRHQGWVDKHPQTYIHGVERWITNRSERVIACSHYMREQIADIFGVDEERVTRDPQRDRPRRPASRRTRPS